jgi:hypothetical protein
MVFGNASLYLLQDVQNLYTSISSKKIYLQELNVMIFNQSRIVQL